MGSLGSLPSAYRSLPLSRYTDPIYYSKDISFMQLNQQSAIPTDAHTQPPSNVTKQVQNSNMKPSRENCDRRRHGEDDSSRLPNISQQYMNQSMTPFLREHIPTLYAPISKPDLPSMVNLKDKDPNSKYCYRHSPDSKCRRAADESKMALIQSVRQCLDMLHHHYLIRLYRNSKPFLQEIAKLSQMSGRYFPRHRRNNES